MQKLLLAAVFMASMQFAAAERAPIAIPKKVQEAINEDKQTCREMGGKFSVGQALDIIDLNNDGYHDFIYDMSKVTCANAPDLGGSGGWAVTVFAGQPDGSAKQAFLHGAVGTKIIDNKLYLGVGGELCGEDTRGKVRAQYQNCIRPLQWNAHKKVFEFAPVSQKKPFPKSLQR
jgi:hypothetical protein